MHGLGDLASAAERQPVDGCDHRFPEGFEPRGHGLAAPDEVPHGRIATATDAACEFVDIGARGERAFAGAGQDHGVCIGVRLDFIQCRHQAIDQIVIQRIEPVGAVECNKRDPVIDFEQHGVGHLGFSGSVGSLRGP